MTLRGGLHVQQGPRFGDAIAMVRECKPGIVLWVDTAPAAVMQEVHSWGGLNVARRYWPHGTEWAGLLESYNYQITHGWTTLRAASYAGLWLAAFVFDGWMERFGTVKELVDYAVGANEYWGSDKPAEWQMRLAYCFEKALHAKFQTIGIKYAAFSLPPGNIEPAMWAQIMAWCKEDGLDFVGDALCVHTYWCSTGGPTSRDSFDPAAQYLVGRECWYEPWPNVTLDGRRVSLPIIISEYGFDNSLSGKPKEGFTHIYTMQDRDRVYADHLLAGGQLLSELAERHRRTYVGWTLFTVGGDDEWVRRGFDATQIWQVRDAIKSLPAQHTEYVQEESQLVYEFTEGFLAYAQEHPEVGDAAGPLEYDTLTGDGVQLTTNGRLVWRKEQNWVGFAPDGQDLPYPPAEPPALVQTVDVSSHQPADLTELIQANGVKHVIVRMYQPGETPSQDIPRQQVASARANGCTVGAYMWLYAAWDARQQIRDAVALMDECDINPRLLWIDYEPYTDGSKPTEDQLAEAIDECRSLGVRPGIYSGAWCWDLGDAFGALPLWAAQYDGIPDVAVFTPFGGWAVCAGKQYSADGIDLSVFLPEYTGSTVVEPEEQDYTLEEWKAIARQAIAKAGIQEERAIAAEARLAAIRAAGGW